MSKTELKLHAYDLDDTIRPGNLVSDVIAYCIQEGLIDAALFINVANPTREELRHLVASLPGISMRQLRQLTDKLTEEARDQAFPWAVERIDHQLKVGHVIILSHSPAFLVRAFAKGLDVHRGRGSYFHTSEGIFSGKAKTLKKRPALRRYMRQYGFPALEFAAGDAETDVPILELAKQAALVNPTSDLAELAVARSWEIIRTDT